MERIQDFLYVRYLRLNLGLLFFAQITFDIIGNYIYQKEINKMKKQWYAVKNISNLVHKYWLYDCNVKFDIEVEEKDSNRYALLHLTKFKVLKWKL